MDKSRPIVLVNWLDSCSPSRKWQDMNDMKGYKPLPCSTVGYLMEKRKDAIIIAASMSNGAGCTEAGDYTAIPRNCVVSIKRLK